MGKEIGNMQLTSFCNDPWHPCGVLNTNHPELKRKNISEETMVSTVPLGNSWRLSYGRGWDIQLVLFNQACCAIQLKKTTNLSYSTKPAVQFNWKREKTNRFGNQIFHFLWKMPLLHLNFLWSWLNETKLSGAITFLYDMQSLYDLHVGIQLYTRQTTWLMIDSD